MLGVSLGGSKEFGMASFSLETLHPCKVSVARTGCRAEKEELASQMYVNLQTVTKMECLPTLYSSVGVYVEAVQESSWKPHKFVLSL